MARRKQKWMDDGSDSDSSSPLDDPDDAFDPDDPDVAAERELFRNPHAAHRGKKRTREQLQEDATYGIWAADDGDGRAGRGAQGVGSSRGAQGKKPDYTKIPTFVAAGAAPSTSKSAAPTDNLSTALPIEAAREDEEDIAMELGGSSDDEGVMSAEDIATRQLDEDDEDEAVDDQAEDDDDLPPVAGLAPPPAAPASEPDPGETPITSSLGFAPRGVGSSRGGIGARAGIGGRGGGGIGSSARAGLGAKPAMAFASATAASSSSGTASPMEGASTPHTGLGAAGRAGIGGAARAGLGAAGGAGAGIGARPNQSLVDALRAELAGPEPASPAETATDSLSNSRTASPAPPPAVADDTAPRERRSFLPTAPKPPGAAGGPVPRSKLSKAESAHFASLASSGSVGMKMLEKMGWQSGTGLGKERQGIVTPVGEGQKLRKKNAGIQSGERSKGALLEEARRKGHAGDDETGDSATRAAAAAEKKHAAHANAWQSARPKKEKKAKTQYKTYEEIVAEQGVGEGEMQQELLVDLNGQALPNQSLSSLPAFGAGSADPTRLPELRHNLTLLCSTFSSTLRSLAREGAGVEQRRAYLASEEQRMRRVVEAQERKLAQLRGIVQCVERVRELESEAVELCRALEGQGDEAVKPEEVLGRFEDEFDRLLGEFAGEYEEMGLDEVVVGAITPVLRRLWQSWDPLASPSYTVSQLKRFRKLFLIDKHAIPSTAEPSKELDVYGAQAQADKIAAARKRQAERQMTAYETLMWTVWLPRVRSAVNNSWSPANPQPLVSLYTAWLPLLPSFLRDNMLDQLILPKVSSAIADWSPSSAKRGASPPLHSLVFPWLEHAGERMDIVLDEAKRKVRGWLKGWKARDGVPSGLEAWKDAFSKSDWVTLLLKHVLPQLGALLRDKFVVNPRSQDLAPLDAVLGWRTLLRSSMLSQLIEAEFFPKWGDALYVWLTSEPNLEQVAEWYSWWKSYFGDEVVALSGVSRGFRKGLDLMNQAMALGEDAKYRLKKPDFTPKHSTSSSATATSRSAPSTRQPTTVPPAPAAEDVSFRAVVEEIAAGANLVFLPTGKVAPQGQTTFRVSRNIDGKGGVTVYLEDDVVWVLEKGGEYSPVGVEEMVSRASNGRA
ncbi:mRNA splicing protein SPP382 [Rhodotorula paludigena]|uniref:mRNA splicing protein SPP382 n=1 Tax=Rhodotorula paludigena TaxID=86838 RepID=UPI00317265D1